MKPMKRICFAAIMLGIMIVLIASLGTTASAETYGDLTYSVSNGEITITGCKTSATEVEIPDQINGYPVTSIDNSAFYGCTGLISITIPDSVKSIGRCAFCECTGLLSITIPDSVTSIGDYAFCYCKGITSVTIPKSVKSIGRSVFSGCTGLTSARIDNYVIGHYEFYNCTELTSVTIADSVRKIGNSAFRYCKGLASITIPDSVTSIGHEVFDGCTGLTSITIPDSVTAIGKESFNNTGYYNNISNWEDNVLYIGKHLIAAKKDIANYTIKDGTLTISASAFIDCTKLVSINIPDSVTSIGNAAFYNTGYYKNASNWENNVLYIGKHLIDAKTNSANYTIKDGTLTIGNYAVSSCKELTSVTIPDSVKTIGNGAFYNCTGLSSITIPDSVKIIDGAAFSDCTRLSSIIILNKDCAIYDSIYTIYSGATIYGYVGSTAQTYAEKNDRMFVSIEHNHKYVSKVTAPTCTKKGFTTYTCRCGDSYVASYVNAIGHNYADATCISTKTCTVCNVTSSSANGHNYVAVTTIKATLTKGGKIENKCIYCDDVKSTTPIYYPKTIELSATKYTYSGTAKAPEVVVKDSQGKSLVKGTDYTVTYPSAKTNAGTYKVIVTMKGNYSGTKTLYYTINPDSSTKTVTLSATKYTYNGNVKAPAVTVKDSKGKTLVKGTDYTVTYSAGKTKVGKYAVTVKFKGNYSGTVTKYFLILPGKTSKLSATTTITTIKTAWNKVTGATGYKVEVINSSGKIVKSVYTKNNEYTFTGLSTLTYYKVKVTAYKTIKDKNEYSPVLATISTRTKPSIPAFIVSSTTKGKANFRWSNVSRETGYQIYCATSRNGTYSKVATYSANYISGSKSNLTSGKTYYFKIRAYKKTGDTVIYSGWSTVKSVKIK